MHVKKFYTISTVVCKLPRAGLGNRLFPLMHALVFSHINNLPLVIVGYHQIKIGPYIRGEKIKRAYKGYFKFEKNFWQEWQDRLKVERLMRLCKVIYEPDLEVVNIENRHGQVFIFEKLTSYHDYFVHLKPHRALVKQLFFEMLSEEIQKDFRTKRVWPVAIHVRMGDFKKMKLGEEFKGGHVRTPETYYCNIVMSINKIKGADLDVGLYTDGRREEFQELLNIKGITLVEGNTDIEDLILMSRSPIIISTTGSTFSYWAGFLGDGAFIKHPDHLHAPLRTEKWGSIYDGKFDINNQQLLDIINRL